MEPTQKCHVCNYFTTSNFLMKIHVKSHELHQTQFDCTNDLEEFSCEKCRFKTKLATSFNRHLENKCEMKTNKIVKMAEKRTLSKLFYNSDLIKLYRRIYSNVHKCKNCPYLTKTVFSITNHVRFHRIRQVFNCEKVTLERFSCEKCQFSSKYFGNFVKHVQTHSSFKIRRKTSLKCTQCDYATLRKDNLTRHINHMHTPPDLIKWHECDQCDYKCKTSSNLKIHVSGRHCGKNFRTPRKSRTATNHNFKYHLIKGKKWYKCDHCDYTSRLPSHVLSHTIYRHVPSDVITWHYCQLCDYKAKLPINLLQHLDYMHKAPDEIQWQRCDQCDYKCRYSRELRNHAKIKHAPIHQIKWLKCDQCDYKSRYSGNLKSHVLWKHGSGEIKWFGCEQCDYRSKYSNNLKTHVLRKHTVEGEIKWFCCEQCDYKGRDRFNLKRHVNNMHTPSEMIEWQSCEHCGYRSKQKGHLNKHKRRMHSV